MSFCWQQPMDTIMTSNETRKNINGHEINRSKKQTQVDQFHDQYEEPGQGIKHALHGNLFQLKIIMLFLSRAMSNKYSQFRLVTEMSEAEKFDDVVLQYKSESYEKWKFRLLQAKHKQNVAHNKIKETELLSTKNDDPFSLQKYFHSFMKIKQRIDEGSIYSVFADNEIEDVIICTNTNFDLDSEKLNKYFYKEDIDADNILQVDKDVNKQWEEASIYRPHRGEDIENNELFVKLKPILEKTSPFSQLVDTLIDSLLKKKMLNNNGIVNDYCYALTKIFIVKTIRQIGIETEYYLTFLLDRELESEEAQNFREALCKKVLDKKSIDEQDIQNLREYEIKISADFAKVLELTKNVPEIKEVGEFVQELKNMLDIGTKNEQRNVYISNCSPKFQDNIIRLAGYVLIKKYGKIRFSTSFIKSEDIAFLPGNLKAFRDELKKNLGDNIFESIYEYKFEINFNGKKKFETCEEGALSRKLPTMHQDKDVVEFFDKLKLVLNYPNQEEINGLLEAVLKEKLQILDAKAFNSMYQEELLDWMGESVGTFYTLDKANKLFSDIEKNLNLWTMNGFTKSYFANTFKKYKFKGDLITKFLQDDEKQVLHLVFDDVKFGRNILFQAFKDKKKDEQENNKIYTYSFGYMCLCSKNLLDQEFCNSLFEWFKDNKCGNLISIESDNKLSVKDAEILFLKLKSLLNENNGKKVILITGEGDNLAEKFANEKSYTKTVPNLTFNNLNDYSQTNLKKKNIMFQGESVCIETLFDENSQHLIDQKLLSKLFDDKKIEIGSKRSELSDLESIHYITNQEITKGHLSNAVKENPSDLFVINETTEDEFLKFINLDPIIMQDKIRVFGRSYGSVNDKFIICSQKEQERNLAEFKQICSEYISIKKENEMFCVHLLELKDSQLIWKRSYDISFYIPREFYQLVIKEESLKEICIDDSTGTNDKKNIFAISNIENNKLEEQYGIKVSHESNINSEITNYEKSGDPNPSFKNHVLILNKEKEKSLKGKLRNKNWLKYFNIHWLQNKKDDGNMNKLVWRQSEGDLKLIRKLQDEEIKFPISDLDLRETLDEGNVIIIADEPGMGKSTALTYLLRKPKHSNEWVLKFNLINLKSRLTDFNVQSNLDKFIEIFFSEKDFGTDENLAKGLLRHRIQTQGMITLLFDGFDEISDTNQDIVIKFLKYLKTTKAKIIVATRLNVKDKLENALSVLSHPFQPFSKENQKEFLHKFWNASLKLTFSNDCIKETLSKHVNTLFEPFYKNIKDDKYKFMSTPLITKMFAESYQKAVEMLYKNDYHIGFKSEIENLSTLNLFEKFIEKKYDIFFKEKKTYENNSTYLTDILIKALNKDHQRLAFHKLFLKHDLTDILVEKDKSLPQRSLKDFKLAGLCQSISSKDDPDFIHLTFAEYFAACILVDLLRRNENNLKYKAAHNFLLSQVFKENNKVVRMFLEQKIKKESSIDLNNKWNNVKNCDLLGEKVSTTCVFRDIKKDEQIKDELLNFSTLLFKFKFATFRTGNYHGKFGHFFNRKKMDEDDLNCLFSSFLKENKDINLLKSTLRYFAVIARSGGCHFYKVEEIILKNIYCSIRHYIVAAQKQNEIDNEFLVYVLQAYNYPYIENFKKILIIVEKLTHFETYSEDQKRKCSEEIAVTIFPSAPFYEEWSILILYLLVISTTEVIQSFKLFINSTKSLQKMYKDKILYFLERTEEVHGNTEVVKCVQSFFISITHHQNIIKDTKLSINKMFEESREECRWLENEGIFISRFLEIFTPEMSRVYNSRVYVLYYIIHNSYSSIFDNFIHPIVHRINKEKEALSNINRIAFMKIIVHYSEYILNRKRKPLSPLPYNSHQLKMTLQFFEEELKKHHNSPLEIVPETVKYLFALGKAGLKLITCNQKLIVLHSSSDFQFEFGCTNLDKIIKLIKWKHENTEHSEVEFLEECFNNAMQRSNLKRSGSESSWNQTKRFKSS